MKRIHSNHSNIHIKIVLFEVDNEKFENEVSSRLIYIAFLQYMYLSNKCLV